MRSWSRNWLIGEEIAENGLGSYDLPALDTLSSFSRALRESTAQGRFHIRTSKLNEEFLGYICFHVERFSRVGHSNNSIQESLCSAAIAMRFLLSDDFIVLRSKSCSNAFSINCHWNDEQCDEQR